MDISIRGIILISIAAIAAIVNFTARPISEKIKLSELAIKSGALVVVLICVTLLMIFGK